MNKKVTKIKVLTVVVAMMLAAMAASAAPASAALNVCNWNGEAGQICDGGGGGGGGGGDSDPTDNTPPPGGKGSPAQDSCSVSDTVWYPDADANWRGTYYVEYACYSPDSGWSTKWAGPYGYGLS